MEIGIEYNGTWYSVDRIMIDHCSSTVSVAAVVVMELGLVVPCDVKIYCGDSVWNCRVTGCFDSDWVDLVIGIGW